ncbi:hypothetical protein L6654_41720 [Bradyrhizobium sp. WYCCWR 13023]|uniref:Uncharacterized protein n=1 Tax=Bradyrhizobium zhengyangense TaxID=2911009 RepID=A0A9X1RKJ4_9BRAD|nr:hypothetical protein [Bradyrhizobium zhengyangense]MCG2633072.1 hypothetical protein [Bradyrhizobium zhengyangense]MCG2668338.1 hypothetical protein [Bradyrhizobium zhengyangense]
MDYEAGTSRFWNGEDFHGTAVVYVVKDGECLSIQCDYELNTLFESRPQDVRAFRENLRRKGLKPRRLPDDQLHSEVVVIFGPELSPQQAVYQLEVLIGKIRKRGLQTGKDCSEDYVMETLTGKLVT